MQSEKYESICILLFWLLYQKGSNENCLLLYRKLFRLKNRNRTDSFMTFQWLWFCCCCHFVTKQAHEFFFLSRQSLSYHSWYPKCNLNGILVSAYFNTPMSQIGFWSGPQLISFALFRNVTFPLKLLIRSESIGGIWWKSNLLKC